MHYTSVLFDLDGTLLDTLGDLTAAMNRTLTRHGLPERTRQQMRTALGNGARRLMELSVPSGTDSALFETLLAEYNADYAAHCRIETAPYPGVAALLRTLHTQGASSPSCPTSRTRPCAHCVRISSPTQSRSLSARRQPSAQAGAGHAAGRHEQLGADPDKTVFVGDSEVDIATARAADLPCISVLWGFRDRDVLERAGAQQFAADIAQLQALLGWKKSAGINQRIFYAILRRRNFSFVSEMRMATRISAKPTITRGSRCS